MNKNIENIGEERTSTTLHLSPDLKKRLKLFSAQNNKTIREIVTEALEKYLKDQIRKSV